MKLLSVTAVALALLASAPAMAAPATQTKTSNLIVTGKISEVCTLAVTGAPAATTLDLTKQQSAVNVGSVASQCNVSSNGYNLDVTTANTSKPVRATARVSEDARGAPSSLEVTTCASCTNDFKDGFKFGLAMTVSI